MDDNLCIMDDNLSSIRGLLSKFDKAVKEENNNIVK